MSFVRKGYFQDEDGGPVKKKLRSQQQTFIRDEDSPIPYSSMNSQSFNLSPMNYGSSFYNYNSCAAPEENNQPLMKASKGYSSVNTNNTKNVLLFKEDKEMLTEYFYYLMQQMDLCHFSDSDRKTKGGSREHVKIGFAGLCCRHCRKTPDARKFFWANVDRISNSFAEIPTHVLKCKHTSSKVKDTLVFLKKIHPKQLAKFPRGSQKAFLGRMWDRMHADANSSVLKETKAFSQLKNLSILSGPLNVNAVSLDPYRAGRQTLALPEDEDWLSPIDCFVRRNIEMFCATEFHIQNVTHLKSSIIIGQVGLRCLFCARSPEGTCTSATTFPRSISQIAKFVRDFKSNHLQQCKWIPAEQKTALMKMKKTTSLTSVLKRYYIISAKALGLSNGNGLHGGVWLGAPKSRDIKFQAGTNQRSDEENYGYPLINMEDIGCHEKVSSTAV